MATRVPQRNVNTVTTNVPGPQYPLYAPGAGCSRRSRTSRSVGRVRVGVAIFSYDGALNFGVTGDYDTAPDIDVLCGGIEQGMRELVTLAAQPPAARGRRAERTRVGREVEH